MTRPVRGRRMPMFASAALLGVAALAFNAAPAAAVVTPVPDDPLKGTRVASGQQVLDPALLDATMQRSAADRGIATSGAAGFRYNTGSGPSSSPRASSRSTAARSGCRS